MDNKTTLCSIKNKDGKKTRQC